MTPSLALSPLAEELHTRYTNVSESVQAAARACGRAPESVQLIAVSKTQTIEVLQASIEAGIRVFGENYVQEIKEKVPQVNALQVNALETQNLQGSPALAWHLIGHLQTNKVRMVVPHVDWIHSVDSVRLASEISKEAGKINKTINILLQVNTSGEESKSGCEPHELTALAKSILLLPNLHVRGLMTIAALDADPERVRPMFRLLRELRDAAQRDVAAEFPEARFDELSMGMSGDFRAAIEEGSTMVRVGTAIFGARNYPA